MPQRFLIPEWAPQAAVLIAWPSPTGDFAPWLDAVESTYAAIAIAIARRQRLLLACGGEEEEHRIRALLLRTDSDTGTWSGNLAVTFIPYDDVWVRDTAPLSVATGSRIELLDFRFNAWGNKYDCRNDANFAARLHATGLLGDAPLHAIDMVLEGGSIESDGRGTLLTTRRCLLNPNRNPTLDRDRIEAALHRHLGAERILWLEHGHAEGDDTDAHIDTLARFCAPDTIAYTSCASSDDPLWREFAAMADELAQFRQTDGTPYHLVPLPMPEPVYAADGRRLPATYANFLIINGAVLVPVYGDPADAIALERLSACFPGRELLAIDCRPLIQQFGSLHCMSMQFPLPPPSK